MLATAALGLLGVLLAVAQDGRVAPATPSTVERAGTVPTRDAMRLRLQAGTGSVSVYADASGEVRYRVHVAAETGNAAAAMPAKQFTVTANATPRGVALTGAMPEGSGLARVQVSYEVHVPRHYDLAISTEAGDIVVRDITGRVTLSTGGGDIRIGNVSEIGAAQGNSEADLFVARLTTGGGRIVAGNIDGGLRAQTSGGQITAGNVRGDAVLHTEGGQIQVGRVTGAAQLTTGGGNIVAEDAGDGVEAETGGGRIEFGSAAGAIRARTGGGGIRIAHLNGPTQLASSNGGVSLQGVEAPVHVSTGTGSITASFSPRFAAGGRGAQNAGSSQLASGQGDIIVYLPRMIAVSIDAQVDDASGHRIVADPSLPLRVNYANGAGGRGVHGECDLNGGGEVIHLKTAAGNIMLRYLDTSAIASTAGEGAGPGPQAQDLRVQAAGVSNAPRGGPGGGPASGPVSGEDAIGAGSDADTRVALLMGMFDELWWGGVRVDPEAEQKRLVRSMMPDYPAVARDAGIEGDVALRVWIGKDGAVTGMEALSGEPVLVRAAMRAVEQWRYQPGLLMGRTVNVVTTVMLAFRLR